MQIEAVNFYRDHSSLLNHHPRRSFIYYATTSFLNLRDILFYQYFAQQRPYQCYKLSPPASVVDGKVSQATWEITTHVCKTKSQSQQVLYSQSVQNIRAYGRVALYMICIIKWLTLILTNLSINNLCNNNKAFATRNINIIAFPIQVNNQNCHCTLIPTGPYASTQKYISFIIGRNITTLFLIE